jgi:hypothetical protein
MYLLWKQVRKTTQKKLHTESCHSVGILYPKRTKTFSSPSCEMDTCSAKEVGRPISGQFFISERAIDIETSNRVD